MTLVAVLSDTHLPRGTRQLPAQCVERLRTADVIVHAGDFTSLAALEELRALGSPVSGVQGNMDDAEIQALLPVRLVVQVEECRIGVVHDAGPRGGRHARLAAAFPGCAAVVYGHSHLPEVDRVAGLWVLNPGSPTERRRAPFRSMLELRVAGAELFPELLQLGP